VDQCVEDPFRAGDAALKLESFRMEDRLTVPLPTQLREFVAREAEREDRSVASFVRRLISAEAERREHPRGRAA
jgi:CopG-like RHH_1 or ribbon-helix-helix domain, RHH_5